MNATATPPRNAALDQLRSFVTLLVLLHHTLLAYHPYAPPAGPFDGPSLLWTAFPVVDRARLPAANWIVGFNDVFFMSLMFLISGVFVWPALARRGAYDFARERLLRLGLPFMIGAAVLAPLAYYPAWRTAGGEPGVMPFWRAWTSLSVWPAGPAWFLWVLLAFGLLAAGVYAVAPKSGERLGRFLASRRPGGLFVAIAAASAAVYVPVACAVDPMAWFSYGAFFVQITRAAHYLVYFTVGIGLGAVALDRGVFAPAGELTRRWCTWVIAAPIAYALLVAIQYRLATADAGDPAVASLRIAADLAFVVSCAVSCLALLALFFRFSARQGAIGASLARNAYGIYLTHYVFVTWLQWRWLDEPWPALYKAAAVFAGTLSLSWIATALLRRLPVLSRAL